MHRRPKPSLAHSSTGLSRFPTLQSIPRPLKLRRRRLRLLRLRLKAASVPRSGHQQASSCYSSPSSTLYYISSTTLLCATLYTAETFPFKHCRRRERPAACPLCLCIGGKSMEADSGFRCWRACLAAAAISLRLALGWIHTAPTDSLCSSSFPWQSSPSIFFLLTKQMSPTYGSRRTHHKTKFASTKMAFLNFHT